MSSIKRIRLTAGVLMIVLFAACSAPVPAYIDKDKKAIISTKGEELKKVQINGNGKTVTFDSYGDTGKNSIIYFNRVNPGFMVTEGFGLNKDYILKLEPGKKYTVYIFADKKDQAAFPIYFKTDYNNNIVIETDKD